jgi:hypothetical protein
MQAHASNVPTSEARDLLHNVWLADATFLEARAPTVTTLAAALIARSVKVNKHLITYNRLHTNSNSSRTGKAGRNGGS